MPLAHLGRMSSQVSMLGLSHVDATTKQYDTEGNYLSCLKASKK